MIDIDEEYRLSLALVNALTERRQTVTTTYLAVNTAIIGAVAFLMKDGQVTTWPQVLAIMVLLLAGITACGLWRRLLNRYSVLMGWWYKQLRTLEAQMNTSNKLVTKEYKELYLDVRGKASIGITYYETLLTWLFTILYGLFELGLLAGLIQMMF